MEGDYYVTFRRRSPEDGGEFELRTEKSKTTRVNKILIDNSWVVSHSPDLLRKFRTHMKVEPCISTVGSIKYLFKYVHNFSDQVTVEIVGARDNENTGEDVPTIDEMWHYQDARYF